MLTFNNNITFIVLTRNNPGYLQRCLNSLKEQTFANWTASVIDTSDESRQAQNKKICEQYKSKVEHWEYYDERGFAWKNNMGIQDALENKECKFMCLLNDDAFPNKNFISDVYKCAGENKKAMAFSPLFLYANEPNKIQVMGGGTFSKEFPCGKNQFYHDVNISTVNEKEINTPKKIDFGYGAAIVYRREVFDKVGFLDDNFRHGFDEPDFAKRMALQNFETMYVPTRVYHICGGSSSKKSFFKNIHIILPMNRAYLYFLLKHYPAKFVVKTEMKRIKSMLRHPRALLIEGYCVIWNIFQAAETRMAYHELYDPKDTKIEIIGGVEKEIKTKKLKVPFMERWLDFIISYSLAIGLLIVPLIIYIVETILWN